MAFRTAIVVLGCRPYRDGGEGGPLKGALARRVREAARLFLRGGAEMVITTGGCRFNGEVEAEAMAGELASLGVPRARIVREMCGMSTRENAAYSVALMRKQGIDHAIVVTCKWHMPRAAALFRREGVVVDEAPVHGPAPSWVVRIHRTLHERFAMRFLMVLVVVAPVLALGCSKPSGAGASALDASPEKTPPVDLRTIARAEDQRRAKDIPDAVRASHDVTVRRRAARALARIADEGSLAGLLRALDDDDLETVAWGAYGLGATCPRGVAKPAGVQADAQRQDTHVRALVARAASLGNGADAASGGVDARGAIARALGRCGGALAEESLASWVRTNAPGYLEAAAYALGDIAGAKRKLADETMTALIDVATGRPDTPPIDVALYPFARMDAPGEAFAPRILAAARAALARPGAARLFAIRALGRSGDDAIFDLVGVIEQKSSFTATERAAAALVLGQMGKSGRAGAADALAYLVPDKDPIALAALAGDEYAVMHSLAASIGAEPPKKIEPSLYSLAGMPVPAGASDSLARRIAELRCTAAGALARGAFDTELLRKCDAENGEAYESARLASLLVRHPLAADRKAAWLVLARSTHVKVREAAMEALDAHAELRDTARPVLAETLASDKAGPVAVAADAIFAHPQRAYTLSRAEIRAALDPSAPPPTADPAEEVDPAIAKALKSALARAWPEDLIETRVAVMKAGIALGLKEAREAVSVACRDANATVRKDAEAALRSLSDLSTECKPPANAPSPADEIASPLSKPTKVTFTLDAGSFGITFDPALAPIAATRFVALARSGFYKGIVVHRVVPGFVVQFGDPGGDGYGGSGKLLRCETSPVAFAPLDVGIALSGRDTGSSQLFVTLTRTPHLDGEYTRFGHAEGDWAAIAEGDVIHEVTVEE